MTWWSWVIVWTVLVVGMLAMLGVSAWLLFRKLMTLLDDLGHLTESAALGEMVTSDTVPPVIAVLSRHAAIRDREAARRRHINERRHSRYDARIARAKAITRLDPLAQAALVANVRERWSRRRLAP